MSDVYPAFAPVDIATLIERIRQQGLTEPVRQYLDQRPGINKTQRSMIAGRIVKATGLLRGAVGIAFEVSERSVRSAGEIIDHGAASLIAEAEAGRIMMSTAAEIARLPLDKQDELTAQGRKAMRAMVTEERRDRADAREGRKAKAAAKKAARATVHIPYQRVKWPTPEETGFPVDGTIEEKDAHHRRYGRTPLLPQDVRHMHEHRVAVLDVVAPISKIAGERWPTPDAYFEMIDAMLAWGKDGTDIGKTAREAVGLLQRDLDTAISRLVGLRRTFEDRKRAEDAAAREAREPTAMSLGSSSH